MENLASSLPTSSVQFALIAAGVVALLYFRSPKTRLLPLPPGPKKLPFFGNVLSMPKNQLQWKVYTDWGKEFKSGIIHVSIYGQQYIIINSVRIAKELLDRRAVNYSGRPSFVMLNELMGCGRFFVHKPYGVDWKQRRSLFHQELHPTQTSRYQPHALHAVRKYLRRYLDDPAGFRQHSRDLVGSAATSITYGITVAERDDPYILNAEQASHGITTAQVPNSFLVEYMPILKYVPSWIPGAGFQKLAAKWKKNCHELIEVPFATVKRDRVGCNELKPSFASYCLDNMKSADIAEEELVIKESAGMFYFAAVDTSVSSMDTFFLAMVLYPEVQKKAQLELDRVLPAGELPDFSYEPSLPYISAVVKELLRWQPIVPIGVPHVVTVDDVFEGYRIPANTIMVANAWAMLHDEEFYPEPYNFKPERFIRDGKLDPNVRDPSVTGVFGFGRRFCPGAHIGKSTIWVFVATTLATMTIGRVRDENGKEIIPSLEYTSATISHPSPFKCTIKARSKEAEDLIRSAANEEFEL